MKKHITKIPPLQKVIRARVVSFHSSKNWPVKLVGVLCLLLLFSTNLTIAQLSITSTGTAFTQNFDGMGGSATATIPGGFKLSPSASPSWATGATATTLAAGTSGSGALTGSSSGGNYNFANGVTASSTDRSIGFLTTGSFASPNSIILKFTNNTGVTVTDLNISFDYEKYRAGTRAWNLTFFHGNAVNPTTAATAGDQAYAVDGANAVVNPPTTISKTVTLTGLSIANGADYYIKWTSTGSLGSSNSQGIGLDNFSITASASASPTITGAATASAFTTTYGTPSAEQDFLVSGADLTADITATAPTGFEVSNGGSYGATTTFAQSGGTASGTLSVRLKADAAVIGTYNSQSIVLSSTGATNVNVTTAASGNSVSAAALTITGISSTNKIYNASAIGTLTGTASYAGLQNSESFSVTGTPVATFAQSTIGTGIGVTVTGYTAPSTNYTVSQPSVSNADITAKPLTISGLTANNKVFDNTTTATLSGTATLVGVETADISNVTLGGAYVADFASAAVGTGIAVNVTGYSLSGSAAGNYSLTQPSGLTADITASAVPTIIGTATATAFSTTYGTASTAQNFPVSGVDLTDDITATAPTGFEVSNGGAFGPTTTFAQAGGTASGTLSVRLRANATVTGTYNSINVVLSSTGAVDKNITTSASGNTVSAAALTVNGITASNKVYDGNTTATLNTGSAAYVGLVNSESFSVSGTITGTFANKNVGNGKTVTIVGVDAPSTNYTVTQPTTTGDITLAPLTITSPAVITKAFDGNTNATITGTLSGVISPDVVTLVGTGTFANNGPGTGISVTSTSTLTGTDAGNYEINPQPSGLTGTITAAPVLYNFGTVAGTSSPTSGTPVANLTFGNVTTGNSVNPLAATTNTTSSSTGYTGVSGSYNYSIVTQRGAIFSTSTAAYYEVTITPATGYNVNLNSLSFGYRATSSGATNIEIYTSADNYGSSISTYTVSNSGAWALSTPTITPVSSSNPLVVRIFGYNPNGATLANNSAANFRMDDLSINADGTLIPPPTASVLSGTGSFCAGSFTNLSVAVTGGVSPYTVVVSDGGSNTYTVTSSTPVSIPVSAAGTYTITSVTDLNSGVGTGNSGSAVVTQNASSLPTPVGTYSATFNHADGLSTLYADNSCNIIANVQDVAGGNTLGNTIVGVELLPSVPSSTTTSYYYSSRYYTITPSSNGSATISLYYTQSDFTSYNTGNSYQLDMPTTANDADPNKVNIRVARVIGDLSTGTISTFTPSSVTWNTTESRWEVTLSPTDIVGKYYIFTPFSCSLQIAYNTLNHTPQSVVTGATSVSVNTDWDDVIGASDYRIRIRTQGSTVWNAMTVSASNKNFTNLSFNTTYEIQVRVRCSAIEQGEYSQTYTFTTPMPLSACEPPSNIAATNITHSSVTMTWNTSSNVQSYTVQLRKSGTSNWSGSTLLGLSRQFSNLDAGTTYYYRVRTNCNGAATTSSMFSVEGSFSTLAALPVCIAPTNITATNIMSNAATLNWDASNNAQSYFIQIRKSGTNIWGGGTVTALSRQFSNLDAGTIYYYRLRTNCTGASSSTSPFSQEQFFTTSSLKPTETATASMFNFNGEQTVNGNHLIWTTLSEQQNKGFVIEHSQDGIQFNRIANVATKAINGESEDALQYSYTHATPAIGVNHYRLQAVGIDGQQSIHSQVVTLDNSQSHTVRVYPNPTHSNISVTFTVNSAQQTTLKVLDMTGRVVKVIQASTQEGENTLEVNMSELSAGMYTLQLFENSKLTHVSKIRKQD